MKFTTFALLACLSTTAYSGTRDSIKNIEERLDKIESVVFKKVQQYDQITDIESTVDEMRSFFEKREMSFTIDSQMTEEQKIRMFVTAKNCLEEIEKNYPSDEYYYGYRKVKFTISDTDTLVSYMPKQSALYLTRSRYTSGGDYKYPSANQCYTELVSEGIGKKDK